MTPVILALVLASPVPIVDTTSATDDAILELPVILPDPMDLLEDKNRGSILFDAVEVDRKVALIKSSESTARDRERSRSDEEK